MAEPEIHFVISAPRSGSTWLTKAINCHDEIFATEHRLFGEFCEVWQNNDGSSSPRITLDKYAQAFAVHYFHDEMGLNHAQFINIFQKSFANFIVGFAQRRTGKRIVLDKITPYPGTASLVVRKIRRMFPDSKIVQLVRDGRDVLTSGTYDWLLKDAEGTPRHDYLVKQSASRLERFFDDEVIKKWAGNWQETITAFAGDTPDVVVTYESMKSDFSTAMHRIFETVQTSGGAQDNAAVETATEATDFQKMTGRREGDTAQPTAKARRGVAGDWQRHFTRRDGELFHGIAGEQLIGTGYVADATWTQQLPDVLDWVDGKTGPA